jgi:hypothetical protein
MGRRRAKLKGPYKSKFEIEIAEQLTKHNTPIKYEDEVLTYTVPERQGKYHPDFKVNDKTFIEAKGKFVVEDRKKHLLLKEQLGPLGYKFYIVFQNANQRISKKSKTTYAMWCEKNGIEYSHKIIKKEWLENNDKREAARPAKNIRSRNSGRRKRKSND